MDDEASAVLVENRKLRTENRRLREELGAIHASRWWRLHPRAVMRRTRNAAPDAPKEAPLSPRTPVRHAGATVAERFASEVVPSLEIGRDSFTDRITELDPVIAEARGPATRVLEIGSYEGLSACFFLWRLVDAEVTCVDTFAGGLDDLAARGDRTLEATFDRNVARVGAGRVTKLADDSRAALLRLQRDGTRFDLVYVDGSHLALDVVVDAALAWRLLEPGGILVFDDYRWNDAGDDALLRPGPAIDAILALLEGKFELLLKSAQVAVRKRPLQRVSPRAEPPS